VDCDCNYINICKRNLQDNQFYGIVPSIFANFTQLKFFALDGNNFTCIQGINSFPEMPIGTTCSLSPNSWDCSNYCCVSPVNLDTYWQNTSCQRICAPLQGFCGSAIPISPATFIDINVTTLFSIQGALNNGSAIITAPLSVTGGNLVVPPNSTLEIGISGSLSITDGCIIFNGTLLINLNQQHFKPNGRYNFTAITGCVNGSVDSLLIANTTKCQTVTYSAPDVQDNSLIVLFGIGDTCHDTEIIIAVVVCVCVPILVFLIITLSIQRMRHKVYPCWFGEDPNALSLQMAALQDQ